MTKLGPYEIGPNDTIENGIYQGNARILSRAIPDESIDLVFCDPVYQNIDDYEWLAKTAARVLKPNSVCLAWSENSLQIQCANAMQKSLSYVTTMHLFMSGVTVGRHYRNFFIKTSPCLLFEKGKKNARHKIWDINIGVSNRNKYGNIYKWGKDPATVGRWTNAFCAPGLVVLDPFTGSGTVPAVCKMLGRKYLAFEIIPNVVELARERVKNTQPPLFIQQEKQLGLMEQ